MKLRSEILLQPIDRPIGHDAKIISIGSCFAERMGDRLAKYKFKCLQNPFGILFHPIPMIAPLMAALEEENPFSGSLFEQEGNWKSLAFHSRMRHTDRDFLESMIQNGLIATKNALESADLLILTFGSAIGFRHLASDTIAGNCHKIPQKEFKKETSRLNALRLKLESFLEKLRQVNPQLRVLLTVSPVRHLRSGVVENAGSKAILRTLSQELSEDYDHVHYFPAWELLMDDLRDYRFYESDLAHPTPLAEDYVWEKFANTWISADARKINADLDGIFRDLAHRPFDEKSDAHKSFLKGLHAKIDSLRGFVDLDLELVELEERLGLR